ncbi:hypothetical protein CRUP_009833, partial [Coryphaenoides rupestris]
MREPRLEGSWSSSIITSWGMLIFFPSPQSPGPLPLLLSETLLPTARRSAEVAQRRGPNLNRTRGAEELTRGGAMYGLLCESLHDFIKESYGDDVWKLVYSESVIPRIAKAASGVLGRHVRDFVNGLDNLHEYLRFSYPKVQPPTFFCQEESATGVTLHYRSKRKGYLHYAMGQLRQMGKQFYDTDIHVEEDREILPITSDFFFEVFPFNVVFRQDMVVHNVGSGLSTVFPDLDGKKITDAFLLARPLVEFNWNMVSVSASEYEIANRSADVDVELMAFQSIIEDDYKDGNSTNAMESWGDGSRCLKLKGQMRYMPEWESIIFLGTP